MISPLSPILPAILLFFIENTSGTLLDTGIKAIVTDADMSSFSGGHLLVQIVGGGDTAEDELGISAGYGTLNIGTSSFNASFGLLDITLNANADASGISALVQNIAYKNLDTQDPTAGTRSVRFTLSDGTGAANSTSPNYDMTVKVQPTNNAPVLALIDASATYTEGGAAIIIDSAVSVIDVDSPNFDGGRLTVQVAGGYDNAEDVLGIQNVGSYPGQIGLSGNQVLYGNKLIGTFAFDTVSGNLNVDLFENADTAAVEALIENITYKNTDLDKPTEGLRTLRYSMWDGDGGSSNVMNASVLVAGVNDAPVITKLNGDVVTFSEVDIASAGAVLLDLYGDATISDVDSPDFMSGALEVVVMNPGTSGTQEDMLSIRHQGAGVGQVGYYNNTVFYSGRPIGTTTFTGNSTFTVTFNSTYATQDAVAAVLHNVTYYNQNSLNPTEGNRTIRFQLNDGDGSANGGVPTSEYNYVTVTVNGMNDAPVIHNVHGDSVVYTEGQSPAPPAENTTTLAFVSDSDSPNLNGGKLTIQIVDTANASVGYMPGEDVLGIKTATTAAGEISIYNNEIILYGDKQMGAGKFDPASGILDIKLFEAADTVAVSKLVQSITYFNTNSLNPTAGQRTVRYALFDGNLNKSTDVDSTIFVRSINSAPTINNLTGDSTVFIEHYIYQGTEFGGSAVLIDQNPAGMNSAAYVTDIDSLNFDGGKVVAEIYTGFHTSDDRLGIKNQGANLGQLGVVGDAVQYGGVEFGKYTFVSNIGESKGVLTVTLDADANTSSVSALLQNITYYNVNSDNPTNLDRKVRFALYDGDGTDFGGKDSAGFIDTTVKVVPVNEKPVLYNLGDYQNYSEGESFGGPASDFYYGIHPTTQGNLLLDMGTNAYVKDVDSTDFMNGWLTVQIFGGYQSTQDELTLDYYTADGVSIGTWAGTVFTVNTFDKTTGSLKIDFKTVGATETAVNALLHHIAYKNTSNYSTTATGSAMTIAGERSIRFQLFDGDSTNYVGIPELGTSDYAFATVNVQNQNDPPTIDGTAAHGWSVTYIEGSAGNEGSAVAIFGTSYGNITDVDSPNFDGGFVAFQIVSGDKNQAAWTGGADGNTLGYVESEDRLTVATNAIITYVNSEVRYYGTTIGTGAFNPGTGILKIDLNQNANETSVEALLRVVSYQNINTGNPLEGYRTIRFMMADGDGGGAASFGGFAPTDAYTNGGNFPDGAALFAAATGQTYIMSVLVSGTNDAPYISNIASDNVTFTEVTDNKTFSDYAIYLDQYSNAAVFDPDKWDNIGGNETVPDSMGFSTAGRLTVQITGGLCESSTEDWLGFSNTGNFTTAAMLTSQWNEPVMYGDSLVGEMDWEPSYGRLTIDFNQADSGMMNETAVQLMIREIMYSNRDSYAPTPGIRTVRFQLSDDTGVGGLSSPGYDMWVNVVPTNDIPAFDSKTWYVSGQNYASHYTGGTPGNVAGSNIYVEASTGYYMARLETSGKIRDVDIESTCVGGSVPFINFDGGYLHVQISGVGLTPAEAKDATGFVTGEDKLGVAISAGGTLSMIGSDIIAYNGVQFGIVQPFMDTGTEGWLKIDFNENAGTAAVDALIQNIAYYNTETDNPTVGLRTIRFYFADGDGGMTTHYQASDNYSLFGLASVTLQVTGVNDAPVLYNLASDVASFCQARDMTDYTLRQYSYGGVILDQGAKASLMDVDIVEGNYSNGGMLSVTILTDALAGVAYSAEDVLHIRDQDGNPAVSGAGMISVGWSGAGTTVWYDGASLGTVTYVPGIPGGNSSGVLTVNFKGATAADEEAVSALLQNIVYLNTNSKNPSERDRSVRFFLWDGGEGTTFNGVETSFGISEKGITTNTVDMLLHVGGANNAPTFESTNTPANRTWGVIYSEGDGNTSAWGAPGTYAIPLLDMTANNSLTQVWIDDADGTAVNYSGGTLTIEFDSGVYEAGEDKLWFNSSTDVGFTVGYANGHVYSGAAGASSDIGTVSWDEASGKLTINLLSGANTTTVSRLIQSITYQNLDSQDPTAGMRSVRFTITEPVSTSSATASCPDQAAGTRGWGDLTINVVSDNDRPEIFNLGSDHAYFYENGTTQEVLVDVGANAWVRDVDYNETKGFQTLSFELTKAHVSDSLSVRNQGIGLNQIGFDTQSRVSYEGNVIGNAVFAATGMRVDFNSYADEEAVSMLIQNVVFKNTSANPTEGDRTIRFTLFDNGDKNGNAALAATSPCYYTTITVVGTNDPPSIGFLAGDETTFYEGNGAASNAMVVLDKKNAVADVTDPDNTDFLGGRMTIEILGADFSEDVIGFGTSDALLTYSTTEDPITHNIGGTVVYQGSNIGSYLWTQNAGKMVIDLQTGATPFTMSKLVQNITYYNSDTLNPSTHDRTVRFMMWDGDGTDAGLLGLSSNIADVKLHVVATNDAPVISFLQDDSVSYFEESAPAVLDRIGVSGTSTYLAASISDLDSANFDGGRLQVQIVTSSTELNGVPTTVQTGIGKDMIAFRDGGYAGISYDGYNVKFNDTPIGTATYVPGTFTMDVELNENANATNVSALIQNITYKSSNTADLLDGWRTVRFSVFDGDGGAGSSEAMVRISGVNDAPAILNIDSDVAMFYESMGKVELDFGSNADVLDVDTTDFRGGFIVAQISSGFGADTAEDFLSMPAAALPVGSFATYSANTHTLTIAVNAATPVTDTLMENIVRNIYYSNTFAAADKAITEGDRNVRVFMNDGDDFNLAIGDNPTSPTYNMTVKVIGQNDPPVIVGGNNVWDYVENDSAAELFLAGPNWAAYSVNDVDSPNFDGGQLVVQITTGYDKTQDVLSVADYLQSEVAYDPLNPTFISSLDGDTAAGNVTFVDGQHVFFGTSRIGSATYDKTYGKLTIDLTEYANTSTVSMLMQNITYANTDSNDPSIASRTIRYQLFDGDGKAYDGTDASNTVEVTVNVTGVNDAPEIFELDGDFVTYTEASAPVVIDQGSLAWVQDVDNKNFDGGRLYVSFWEDSAGIRNGKSAPGLAVLDGVDTSDEILGIKSDGNDHWDSVKVVGADVFLRW